MNCGLSEPPALAGGYNVKSTNHLEYLYEDFLEDLQEKTEALEQSSSNRTPPTSTTSMPTPNSTTVSANA